MRLIDADALKARFISYTLPTGVAVGMDRYAIKCIDDAPTIETSHGYRLEHLALIAAVMAKEGVTAETAIEFFNDTGRIVKMIADEMQEQLNGAVQNCFGTNGGRKCD